MSQRKCLTRAECQPFVILGAVIAGSKNFNVRCWHGLKLMTIFADARCGWTTNGNNGTSPLAEGARARWNDRVAGRFFGGEVIGYARELLLDDGGEFGHLPF